MPFAIECSRELGRLRLGVAGELDLAHSPKLAAALARAIAAGEEVLLDLRRCELVDTTALAAIVDAAGRLAALGRNLILLVPEGGTLRRQLEVTGLLDAPTAGADRRAPPADRFPGLARG